MSVDNISVDQVVDYFQSVIKVLQENDEGSTAYDEAVDELSELGEQLSELSHNWINLTNLY
jgi:hypothetical protein